MKNLISYLLLGLLSWVGFSQNSENQFIGGKIVSTDKDGNERAVPGAKIRWKVNQQLALTKEDGSFRIAFHHLPDSLIIKSVGFEEMVVAITKPSDVFKFNLTEGKVLEGVVVVAEIGKYIDLRDPMNIETIGAGELRKAACCNLSESFETNASVDVNITDAVSGAKKIQMLGLDGVYTQLQWEQIPLVRGLSTSYGLSFTPGTWINSIQITKGTGSVVNGYETMAGTINLELIKPADGPKLYVNGYVNKFSRGELNIHGAQKLNEKWSTMSFIHASHQQLESDVNKDGFRDMPNGTILAGMHRWQYHGKKMESRFGIKGTFADKFGGQLGSSVDDPASALWSARFKTEHLELFSKAGFFLKNRKDGSIGTIAQVKYHHMKNTFGNTVYEGYQRKFYANVIYGDVIGKQNHSIKTGLSFIYDDYQQWYNTSTLNKTEIVPGAFFEYTFNKEDKFIAVLGVRGDYHNLYGPLYAPRMHVKWNLGKKSALRISSGRGLRVPNPYADYNGLMASSRTWILSPDIQPEDCISSGITFTQKFMTNNQVSTFSVDYFYTHFFNTFLADMDQSPQELHLYNSTAVSYSHAAQAELSIKPNKVLEFRTAFKLYDVKAGFGGTVQSRAFVPRYRALFNIGYQTRNKKWMYDVTANFVSQKRLPSTATNPSEYQRPDVSKSYWLLNSQLTYNFKRFSIYVGGENLLNVIQKDAIIAADDPFGSYFDATQIWAPISGFNVYAGFHFEIKQKEKK